MVYAFCEANRLTICLLLSQAAYKCTTPLDSTSNADTVGNDFGLFIDFIVDSLAEIEVFIEKKKRGRGSNMPGEL